MTPTTFQELADQVLKSQAPKRVAAVIAPEDAHTLEAVIFAADRGLVEPLLFGRETVIKEVLGRLGQPEGRFSIVDTAQPAEAARAAGLALKDGRAHFLMKGLIPTGVMLKALFDQEVGFRTGSYISHATLLEIPGCPRLVGLTDAAITTDTSLAAKRAVLENAVAFLTQAGLGQPKVAVLAAVEEVNPKMPETQDAAELKALNQRGEIKGCLVEGPVSYDLAMCPEAAAVKGVESPVYGRADLLVCPGLASANILLKALRHSAGALSAGVVVGGRAPIVLTSRAASTEDKYWPLVLAARASF